MRTFLRPPVARFAALWWLILLAHTAFALFYNFAIPLEKGPDEPGHYAYIRQLVTERALPVLTDPTATRDSRTDAHAIHPPLYYLYGAIPSALFSFLPDAAHQHVLRFFATLLCLGTIFVIARIGRLLLGLDEDDLEEATLKHKEVFLLCVVAFVALLPHFLLLASVMNNDGMMIFGGALFLYLLLKIVRDGAAHGDFMRLGALFGLLLLTKGSALALAPLGLLLALWETKYFARGWRSALMHTVSFYGVALLISAWWYARFYFMIGRLQPVPSLPQYESIVFKSPLEIFFNPAAPLLIQRFVAGIMRSVWGQVDWFLSPPQRDAMGLTAESFWGAIWGTTLPQQPGLFLLTLWIYRLFFILAIGALIGLFVLALHRREKSGESSFNNWMRRALSWMAIYFGLFYFALLHFTLFTHPGGYEGGRYLLPTIGAYAVLFVSGWRALLPPRAFVIFSISLALLLVLWNISCGFNLIAVLNPLYALR